MACDTTIPYGIQQKTGPYEIGGIHYWHCVPLWQPITTQWSPNKAVQLRPKGDVYSAKLEKDPWTCLQYSIGNH